MATITSLTDRRTIPVQADETILVASLKAGIPHAHACGGQGRCSTCRVIVTAGLENCEPRQPIEQELATQLGFPDPVRLACQTHIQQQVELVRPVIDAIDHEIIKIEVIGGSCVRQIGEEKTIALLFADIAEYTPFTASLLPYDVIHVLSRYFKIMGEVINTHHGTIVDTIGDGLFAVFGLEIDRPNCCLDAIAAGLSMFQALENLNTYLCQMYQKTFQIRIGIHYGSVIVGNTVVNQYNRLAVIGDAVNVASRIEAANKAIGTHFLISADVYQQVATQIKIGQEFTTGLKGKSEIYQLYEVIDLKVS